MGATSSSASPEGIVTVSSGHHAASHHEQIDPIISGLQELAKDVPSASGRAMGPKDTALQEELKLSALVTEASESLAADVSDSISQYQSWATARLRRAASQQLLIHDKIEKAVSKADDTSQHISRLTHVASGINNQLNAISKLPEQIDGLCNQLKALQLRCEQLQTRLASSKRA